MERSAERRIVLFVTGLLLVAMPGQILVAQDTLVATGSVWKYLDDGSNQGIAWYGSNFDDSGWASGPAELGYGDGDEATVVSYGPNPNNKYRTTYFRHSFSVPDASVYNSITLNVKRDDGVVVYLNGNEVFRENMSDGMITYMTPAASAVESSSFYSASIDVSSLVNGTNVLAVEIHQHGGPSSDISFDLNLVSSTGEIVTAIVRGPYLQNATPQSVSIMWRTSVKTSSKVWYGTSLITLDQTAEDSNLKTDHTMRISGLNPDTKYYYLIGSIDETVLAGGDEEHYFVTNPVTGSIGAIRIWVLGDSGTANNNSRAVKNAYLELAGNEKEADIWLMLGDNAYNSGTDAEYQNAVFNMYPEILRNKVLWSTRGNHEMSSSVYYGIFDLPTNGEGGGLASGTEHYYSFDYANVHFICLNSQESNFSGSPGSAMYQWLEEDLANTQQKWIVAYWHHPPYTKGSHDSDTEGKLIDMRENALPILEAGGVDLVLAGHSHSYERSLFINGHYAHSSSFDPGVHVVQAGSGREDGDGAYVKSEDDGTVYIVAGSSGKLGGGSMDHPVMYFSERQFGSLIIDVQGSRMDVRFLREYTNPTQVDDYFTIQDTSLTAMFVGPADGLTYVPPQGVVLRWVPGEYASEHDVYFGSVFDDVNNATATVDPGGVYLARQDPNYYPISGALDLGETYYWRVDEVNGPPDFTIFEGEVWTFTIAPGNSIQPEPANGALAVTIDATLGWSPGPTAATHNVYFGTSSPPAFIGNQEAATYYPGPLEPGTTYYWQIDEVEADGTTIYTGDIWSFKTAVPNAGVKAQYYHWNSVNPPEAAFETLVLTRVETEIDFDWGNAGSPDPLVNVNNFSAKWLAIFEAPYSETYTFWTESDDGVLLWLDGELIIYSWFDQSATWAASAPIELTAGQQHTLEMWYYEGSGFAVARLHWESPTIQPRQVIPGGLLQLPLMALEPDPADGAIEVPKTPTLSWTPGYSASTHDVYFSAEQQAVIEGNAFIGNQAETSYSPSGLSKSTTYYWRVDEVETDGTTKHTGGVWSFMTAPGYATQPYPANNAVSVAIDGTLSWLPGFTAATHDVYFGTSSPPAFIGNLETATYYPGPLEPSTTYYWQVDEIEADGTTIYTGDIWSFKTLRPWTGTILYEVWINVGYGNAISDLTSNENYPHNPIFSTEVMLFEAITDITDAFGARLHGYLHPETSGDYTFWIASDDRGELWLSTDTSPANAVLISTANFAAPRDFDSFAVTPSGPIHLEGGKKYYIMALYKESWGPDHCAVAWEGPDSPTRAVIHGYYLSPYVELRATSPSPTDGTTEVKRTPTLSWLAGGNTASVNGHELYFSSDVNAVNDRIAEKVVLSEASYSVTTRLDPGQTYYWCVDEVDADGITRHRGDVWSFTVTVIPGRG